ncbi:MAG: aminotransferase class III-fold pyridoxal phosphate-dependent enzyme [Saprospiraceae bacterium]|nr:aminotransferase class III-fold pyridoxal phosphate-dependent enzyme [Saprospiraceae bacterium]
MLETAHASFFITENQAENICFDSYGIRGKATRQVGELDANFKIETAKGDNYILKISLPSARNEGYFDFQEQLLLHIGNQKPNFKFPKIVKTANGDNHATLVDTFNQPRKVRLLEWISGRLWSDVNPQLDNLRESLGIQCGAITRVLQDFTHDFAKRELEWDIAQSLWIKAHLSVFDEEQKEILSYFIQQFDQCQTIYARLRKSVVHSDANDNNIIVSDDLIDPSVLAVIDYGDAIYTQTINDLAVTLAYAIMGKPDPLSACVSLVSGYNTQFPLKQEELSVLYTLVAMRLAVSVTKSALNKIKELDNVYLTISEKPAWALLRQWRKISPQLAHFTFRSACGFTPVPNEKEFADWAKNNAFSLNDLLPSLNFSGVLKFDLSVGSLFLGNYSEYKNTRIFTNKFNELQFENPDKLIAGGYLEARPLYSTDAYKIESNQGYEYRTIHLGVDFWEKENAPIHALLDGEVADFAYNGADKDYGGVIILKHKVDKNLVFYTLYGHLSKRSIENLRIGKRIKKGKKIAELGKPSENGNWTPHLHFQIMLDLLGYEKDFPGVGLPSKINVWSSICPDPNLLFKNEQLITLSSYLQRLGLATQGFSRREVDFVEKNLAKPSFLQQNQLPSKENPRAAEGGAFSNPHAALIDFRKQHLGKSLSISYAKPLKILRGEQQYLIDDLGQRYLDTVNNVAHLGHEHPKVVKAGQQQMAILNTNTRYLHENILDFAKELLATLPNELSVLHFVNSGSEANELALRMAQAATHQKDVIALEVGYHGNTSGCIAVSSYKFDGKGGKGKPENTHIVPLPDSFRGKYRGDKSETGALYAAHVEEAIQAIQAKGRNVGAFLAESIVSCGGQIDLPDNYLTLAYDAVRKAGGVCIADEVQVGFGRVGKHFWGFELQNVVPDIVTMGKPIGNGHPLAAVACTEAVALAFANGMEFFNTFGGNPVSCAIGSAVLKVMKEEKLQENALKVGEWLKTALKNLQKDYPLIGDVRGEGLFLGFELIEPPYNAIHDNHNNHGNQINHSNHINQINHSSDIIPATAKTAYLANRIKEHGVLISVDGPQNNVIKIKPPMCFSEENARELIGYLKNILGEDFLR